MPQHETMRVPRLPEGNRWVALADLKTSLADGARMNAALDAWLTDACRQTIRDDRSDTLADSAPTGGG